MSESVNNVKPPVLCLLGPTASGKTGLAVDLVQQYPFEIVSVDSALVYRAMDIGTAKPTAEVLALAPHALIDLVEPWQSYSVSRFLQDVDREMVRITGSSRIPLLTGGTMLYFNALWNGLSQLPESSAEVRRDLQITAESIGWQAMHRQLAKIDSAAAARIHPNDPQRILRALEVHQISGVSMSELQCRDRARHNQAWDFYNIGIFPQNRVQLHADIALRFNQMLETGFEQEVSKLRELPQMHRDLPSMRCVGYRQMWAYLNGDHDAQEMKNTAIAATRQLAKRQFTWMRRMQNLHTIDLQQPSARQALLAAGGDFDRWLRGALRDVS